MKRSPREIKEAKKAYDKVVDHLITEDYAKTKEDADQIISGMSEDWYYTVSYTHLTLPTTFGV